MSESTARAFLIAMRNAVEDMGIPSPLVKSRKAFPVLISTIISLRTKDAVTEKVSRKVLDRVPDVDSMIAVEREELEELLHPAGFYRQKADQMKRIAVILRNQHEGRVPDNMDSLLNLPGVGRKTANFVLGMVFGVPSICVDIHVHRIANRQGLVNTKTPEDTEYALQKLFSEDEWTGINHTMVRFGQQICKPVKPLCHECPLEAECPKLLN